MANIKMLPAPKIEDREMIQPLLCGAGPCNMYPSVFKALANPVISPLCDEYYNVVGDIHAGIQYLFQTRSKLVFAVSGSGHLGMETVITNLVGPGETLLIASRGFWDERALNIAKRHGIHTVVTSVPMNETFSFDQLESELKSVRPVAMSITHGDSSTGSVQKIEGLGKLCHKYRTLLIVDTVVSIGGEMFLMDEWEVDGVFCSTQKALGGPAGISAVGFSAKAEEKIKNRTHQPPFYMDVPMLAGQWNCYGNTREYHHTMSPPLLWALRCCLQELVKETLPKAWERHAAVTSYFHNRLQDAGFELFIPKPEDRLATVTTVMVPKGHNEKAIINYMIQNHNVMIFGGRGPTAGKVFRIGVMGYNATVKVADRIINSLVDALKTFTTMDCTRVYLN